MTQFSAEDRQSMCDTFERLLRDDFDDTQLRKHIESESGFDKQLWAKMADLGLLGIMIDPDYDGVGGSIREAQALMQVAGRYLFTGPFISSCIIAPSILSAMTDKALAATLLQSIAYGTSIFSVAGCDTIANIEPENIAVVAKQRGEAWQLNGKVDYVQHGQSSDKCIVLATVDDGTQAFLIDADSAGVVINSLTVNDQTLRLAQIDLQNASALKLDGVDINVLTTALNNALVAQAGMQAGAAREVFDRTVDYLKTRCQFGRPIGTFQALKHMAAELLIEVESMDTVAQHAASALSKDAQDKQISVNLAAFTCSDGFRQVAAQSIQLHGGIAYTMEHFAHLYWRRAQTCMWLYGSPDEHRELYLTQWEKQL